MEKIPIIREFMTTKLITVHPDTEIYAAIDLLLNHKISGALVVETDDQQKRLIGILSGKDCMSILANGAFYDLPAAKVSNYMSTDIVSIEPDKDIFAAADVFLENHFRRIPVVHRGFLIGVVSRGDILNASRRLWQNQHVREAPDPGYLTDGIKAKLGDSGVTRIRKKLG
jgi:CBS domain-containing protein